MISSKRYVRKCPECGMNLLALQVVGVQIADEKTGTCARCAVNWVRDTATCPNQAEEPVSKTGSCGFESHRGYNVEALCRQYLEGA